MLVAEPGGSNLGGSLEKFLVERSRGEVIRNKVCTLFSSGSLELLRWFSLLLV